MSILSRITGYRKLIFITTAFLLINQMIAAQEFNNNKNDKCFWLNCGIGSGIGRGSSGLAHGGNISYLFRNNLLSIRSVYTGETQWENSLFKNEPYENFWDAGVLYGRNIKVENDFISIAVGVAIVGGKKRGQHIGTGYNWISITQYYEELRFLTVGIPIQFQLLRIPISSWGLGITGFANLNRKNSFVGMLLSSAFGKFK